jgi:hypothetical protein
MARNRIGVEGKKEITTLSVLFFTLWLVLKVFRMFWWSHIHKLLFSLRIVVVVGDKLRLQRIIYENAE